MKRFLLAGLLGLAVAAAQAQLLKDRDRDFEDEKKEWQEIEVAIPAYPAVAHMRQFEAGDRRGYRYYLDARSVAVGSDGVVRYIVAVVSPGGGRNVTFEGIRCEERNYRVYAIGKPDRTWSPMRESQWRHLQYTEVGNHRFVLFAEYFCNNKFVKPAAEIGRLVESGVAQVFNRTPYPGP